MQKELTKKEADELRPHIVGALKVLFKGLDKGISLTNRDRAEAWIWQSIDDREVQVIADHLVSMGLESRLAATALRGMARTYRTWEIGVITLPRAVLSIQFYAEHGGFAMPFNPARPPVREERGTANAAGR